MSGGPKLGVIGAGVQARAIVDDFLRFEQAETVGLCDLHATNLHAAEAHFADERLKTRVLHVEDSAAMQAWLSGFDAVVSAVPYRYNAQLAELAVSAGTHFTDLGGNNDVVAAELALDDRAKAAGVAIVPDLGLAPGLAGLLGADLVRELDSTKSLKLRVGGLPQEPIWPLDYRLMFSVSGLVNEYIEPCRVLRGGKIVSVPGLSELETLEFPAPFGLLEAFQTSGGTSTLIESLGTQVSDLDYKTIRYPGHCENVRLLDDLGFFRREPVLVEGSQISPRAVTEAVLSRSLGDIVPDVVLLRVEAVGCRSGNAISVVEELIEYPDDERGLSAMARCTGYPAAIITAMLARGEIASRGALLQENVVPMPLFRRALAERGISIHRQELAQLGPDRDTDCDAGV